MYYTFWRIDMSDILLTILFIGFIIIFLKLMILALKDEE
jgi:hypothetical protein